MKVTVCDRCKETFSPAYCTGAILTVYIVRPTRSGNASIPNPDLCEKCFREYIHVLAAWWSE